MPTPVIRPSRGVASMPMRTSALLVQWSLSHAYPLAQDLGPATAVRDAAALAQRHGEPGRNSGEYTQPQIRPEDVVVRDGPAEQRLAGQGRGRERETRDPGCCE